MTGIIAMRKTISPRCSGRTPKLLVCCSFQPFSLATYTGGGLALDISDESPQSDDRNSSPAILHPPTPPRQTTLHPPDGPSPDHSGHDESSTSIRTNDPKSAGADLHDGSPPRGESVYDVPDANIGNTTDTASRGCRTSPDLNLF